MPAGMTAGCWPKHCVRAMRRPMPRRLRQQLPATMNRFLDVHGVLDADYEPAAQEDPRFRSILRPDHEPTPLAGNAMVVVDSSQDLHVTSPQRNYVRSPWRGSRPGLRGGRRVYNGGSVVTT